MSEGERLSLDEKLKLSELYCKKAMEIFRELETLKKEGFFLTLANRAYYAVFNMSKSILSLYGKDPVSHKGVRQLLHIHLYEERDLLKTFDELMEYRQKTDYDVFVSNEDISEKTADEILKKTEKFLKRAHELREDIINTLS